MKTYQWVVEVTTENYTKEIHDNISNIETNKNLAIQRGDRFVDRWVAHYKKFSKGQPIYLHFRLHGSDGILYDEQYKEIK